MRNIALIYSSRYGQTEKIARQIQQNFESRGCNVESYNLKNVVPVIGPQIDGVIIGGPVYAGGFHRAIRKWSLRNRSSLRDKRIGLFVVALNSADKHETARKADDELLRHFMDWTGVVPDQIANFAGALKYTRYPFFLRPQMKKIAEAAGGDTDVSRDYEYTDWKAVRAYCDDFREMNGESTFAVDRRLPMDRAFDSQMRFFELSSRSKVQVSASAAIAQAGFSKADAREMKGASALAAVRTLGAGKATEDPSFAAASKEFGVIPLGENLPHEVLGGLVGQFWRLDFGIKRMAPSDFASFDEPGFTKVLTRFAFVDQPTGGSEIRSEMRIHSTDERAARRFRLYWFFLSIGISLYMRSILRGLKRQAEREARKSLSTAPV